MRRSLADDIMSKLFKINFRRINVWRINNEHLDIDLDSGDGGWILGHVVAS